jgi:hypothetical protein
VIFQNEKGRFSWNLRHESDAIWDNFNKIVQVLRERRLAFGLVLAAGGFDVRRKPAKDTIAAGRGAC